MKSVGHAKPTYVQQNVKGTLEMVGHGRYTRQPQVEFTKPPRCL